MGDVPLQIKLLTTTKELAVTSKFWKMFDNCLLIEIVCRCVADFLCLSNNETGGEEGWSGPEHYNWFVLTAWVRGQCQAFFADGVCGEVGQRLYIGPDGNGTCDCEEASLRSSCPPL